MKRLHGSILVALVLLPLSSVEAGKKLRYSFTPGKLYRYEIHADNDMSGQMSGQEFTASSRTVATVTVALEKVRPDGLMDLLGTVGTMKTTVTLPMMGLRDTTIAFDEMNGKRVRVTITPTGKTIDIAAVDSMPRNMLLAVAGGQITEFFRRLFVDLPEQEVAVKSTWMQTEPETTSVQSMTIINRPKIRRTVESEETRSGFKCWKIVGDGTMVTEGSGTVRGMEVTSDATVKSSSTVYMTLDGLLVELDALADANQVQSFAGQAGGSSTQIKVHSTAKLLK